MILPGLAGVLVSLNIYKQEVGCKLVTPELQPKVDELDGRQKKLIEFKDAVNLLKKSLMEYFFVCAVNVTIIRLVLLFYFS